MCRVRRSLVRSVGRDGAGDDARGDDGEDAGGTKQRDRRVGERGAGDEQRADGEHDHDTRGDLPVLADDEVPPEAAEPDDELHAASFVSTGVAAGRRPLPYGVSTRIAT